MTNGEKYRSIDDRVTAFRRHCADIGCTNCCIKPYAEARHNMCVDRCILKWLAIEAEEEKPLPCPFCGKDNIDIFETDFGRSEDPYQFVVKCKSCGALVSAEDKAEAIAAWNRRAK